MYDELVVVATNNGTEVLPKLLASLGDKWPILVVDTQSTDQDFLAYVQEQPLHCQTPYKGYSSGAYLWAYWNYPAQNYLFLQDSMEANDENYLNAFKTQMPEMGAVDWCRFGFGYDNTPQKQWADYYYGEGNDPAWGIFGPVFYTSRKSLDIIDDYGLLPTYPFNKAQAQGSERLWAVAYHRANLVVNTVAGEWSHPRMVANEFPIFSKVWLQRP